MRKMLLWLEIEKGSPRRKGEMSIAVNAKQIDRLISNLYCRVNFKSYRQERTEPHRENGDSLTICPVPQSKELFLNTTV